MATLLYRIGLSAYRHPWRMVTAWLLIVGAICGIGFGLGGKTEESFTIPGTESQEAIDKLAAVFPQAAGASVQVVFSAPDGASVEDKQYRDVIEDIASELEDVEGVVAVTSPYSEYATNAISDDGAVGIATVQLRGQTDEVSDETIADVTAVRADAEEAGLGIDFGGQVFQDNTFGITVTEALGVLFAGVVLLVTFGSFLAAGLPLLSALLGVGVAIGGITLVTAFVTVSSTAPLLALMIGLAVGIDYSLFILSRHRTQLAVGVDPEQSAATSVATAGSAVVFAGLTVIIALLGLLVVGIPFLSVMGLGAAFAVIIAVLIAVTLVPALLGLAGRRLAPKVGSRAHRRALAASGVTDPDAKGKAPRPSFGMRWVALVLKAPIVAVLLVVGLLGALLIPALQLQLSLPDNGSEPAESTQRQAYDTVTDAFGPGRNGPLVVLVDITQTTDIFDDLEGIADRIRELPDVAYVNDGTPNATVDTAIIQVIPESAPDAPETTALVESIRDLKDEIEEEFDTPIAVTGTTAVMIDISSTLGRALVPFGAIVVGLSIILLMMVFRSLFVPIKAALGFLLSVVGCFGVVVLVFQNGLFADVLNVEPGPILSFLPILLMAVLFGLAMDYEVFLVSGMREEYVKTGDARGAVSHGFANAARVVTAAALIMFFVFFAFVPEGSGAIKPIALALAVGVVFDAFLVRMTLVPAAMALAGRAAWYLPRWIQRVLPNVDIEGEGLTAHREGAVWAEQQTGAITAERLAVSPSSTPIDFTVPAGAVGVVRGETVQRRMLLAAIAGRYTPHSGQLSVLGLTLPTDSGAVSRRVSVAGVPQEDGGSAAVGELLSERLQLASPWYRVAGHRQQAAGWLARINRVLADYPGTSPIDYDSAADRLSSLERLVLGVALAATAGAEVTVIDVADANATELDAVAAAAAALSSPETTILLGVDDSARARGVAGRQLVQVALRPGFDGRSDDATRRSTALTGSADLAGKAVIQ